LRGIALVPPLAGRSPSYILRQLLAFKTKSRSSPLGAPMSDVAATLEIDDMIAAAAYAGSRKP
jgi:cytochrome c553